MIKDYSYQEDCVKIMCNSLYETAKTKGQIIMPTGTGKTITFIKFIKEFLASNGQGKILIFEQQIDLAEQTSAVINTQLPECLYQVMYDGAKIDLSKQIIIATRQTMINQYTELPPDIFDIIIIDECHHAKEADSTQYKQILEYFTPMKFFGFTATGDFSNGFFSADDLIYLLTLEEAQKRGVIIEEIIYYQQNISDLDNSINLLPFVQSAQKSNNILLYNNIISAIQKNEHKHCVVYFNSIALSDGFAAYCQNLNMLCYSVTSNTTTTERQCIYEQFQNNPNIILSNVNILQEGIDLPCIETIFIAKPVHSPQVYKQILGRGLRCYPNKNNLTVYDMLFDNTVPQILYSDFALEELLIRLNINLTNKNQKSIKMLGILRQLYQINKDILFKIQNTNWLQLKPTMLIPQLKNLSYITNSTNPNQIILQGFSPKEKYAYENYCIITNNEPEQHFLTSSNFTLTIVQYYIKGYQQLHFTNLAAIYNYLITLPDITIITATHGTKSTITPKQYEMLYCLFQENIAEFDDDEFCENFKEFLRVFTKSEASRILTNILLEKNAKRRFKQKGYIVL